MSEINIVEIAIATLTIISLVEFILINKIRRDLRETEKVVCILLKEDMKGMAKNFAQGLENLFNPKDEQKNNGKKTKNNGKSKHKN